MSVDELRWLEWLWNDISGGQFSPGKRADTRKRAAKYRMIIALFKMILLLDYKCMKENGAYTNDVIGHNCHCSMHGLDMSPKTRDKHAVVSLAFA